MPRDQPLATITGTPPQLVDLGDRCRFADRCEFAQDKCRSWDSELLDGRPPAHGARCVRSHEIDLRVAATTTPFEQENA